MNDQAQTTSGSGEPSRFDRYTTSSGDGQPGGEKLIDLATVRGFIWRQRFVLLGVTATALLLGFILTLLATPIYEARSVVRVDPEQNDIFEGESLTPMISVMALDSYLATVARVVESRSVATQVVNSLKLDKNDAFLGIEPGARPEGLSDRQWTAQRLDMAIDTVLGNIDAEVPAQQRLVEIGYRSDDPQLAMQIANSYADSLLTDDLRRSLQKNAYAETYLRKEIVGLRGRLDDAQRRALGYARANGIIGESLLPTTEGGGSGASQTVTAANLGAISEQASEARARRIVAEQTWRAVVGTAAADMPAFIQSGAGQNLITQRSQLEAKLAELRQRYGPEHPDITESQAQLAALNGQINQLGGNFRESLRNTYESAARQESVLQGELRRISGETLDEQDRRVAFDQLNDDASALQTQLDALLTRYNQIAASANVTPSTITMLDRAARPKGPVSPNLINNLLIALVIGSGLALGLAVLRETLDDRLRSEEDVENKLGIPLLGVTPLVDKGEEMGESIALAEAHSSIRAALDFALSKPDHNIVLLTSSQSVEGKTTTAVAVAREYARLGRKVLLVDADLRRPSVAGRFGFKRPAKGFAEVLAGDALLKDVLLDSPTPGLDILPVGAIPPNPVEVISSPRVDEFFDHYRNVYNLILIDSPPIVGLADAPLLSRVADGVVFVVESNRAHFGQAKTALRRLRDGNAKMLGVVLTKFRALDAGYNYNYNYSYYTYGSKAKD